MTGTKGLLLAFLAGMPLVAQTAPEPLTPWATGSAAVALGSVVAWLLTRTIPRMQQDFRETLDAMAKRHDKWEQTRHQDSAALNDTLRAMSMVCARVHELEAAREAPPEP